MSITDQARKIPDDEQSVDVTTTTTLRDTDATAVRTNERERKNRAGVIPAADQHMGD